jgi:hypothetical protein
MNKQSENSVSIHVSIEDDHDDDEMPCICCSGAYESFESITSVMESRKAAVKLTSVEKNVVEAQARVEKNVVEALARVEKNVTGGIASVVGAIASVEKKGKWNASCSCKQCAPWKKYPLGSDEALLQCVDDWQTLAEDGSNARVPCGLLKSGSATCQCAECCGGAIYDDNHTDDQEYLDKDDDSVHSEECLDMLSETHV